MIAINKIFKITLFLTITTGFNPQKNRGILHAHGFDVDTQDKNGQTNLHKAIIRNNIIATKFWLRMGASVHVMDNQCNTPSYYAEQIGNYELSRLLFEHGAHSCWVHLPPR